MAELYTYAVARIRAKEVSFLSRADIEQLMTAKSYKEAVAILTDKGFDGGGSFSTSEELLSNESEKTWSFISELVPDMSVFDVFLYEKDFHNLKTAVKAVYTDVSPADVFIKGGRISADEIYKAVSDRNFADLPEFMRAAGANALDVLNRTGDGQLCDVIIDKATIEAVRNAGRASDNDFLDRYSELTVAIADIKIAVRSCRLKKSAEFMKSAIADCDTLDTDSLISSASKSIDELYSYLSVTAYSACVDALKISNSEFEKWCDNLIVDFIREQKTNPFTIAPIAAYILARENEIKTVRIILSAKQNGLDEGSVRERLRDMYV